MKKLQCFAGEYMILSVVQCVDSTEYTRDSHWVMQRNQTTDNVLFLQGAVCVRILCKRRKTIKPIKECINMLMHKGAELTFYCQC